MGPSLFSNNSPEASACSSHKMEQTLSPFFILLWCYQVTSHYTEDFLFNAAISRLMGLTNTLSVSALSSMLTYMPQILLAW